MEKNQALKELQQIPGVGKSIANDLWNMNIKRIQDLKDKDPQVLYDDFCDLVGQKVDRCMLYVFRCAVYYASEKNHDAEKLKWWNWK